MRRRPVVLLLLLLTAGVLPARFRSLSSGEVINRGWTRFSFPVMWHYDVLRGLDYLRSAGVEPDERVAEAAGLVAKRRHQNGRWPLHEPHPDPVHFEMENGRGKPSPLEHTPRPAGAGLVFEGIVDGRRA